jgi:hypothetical protein
MTPKDAKERMELARKVNGLEGVDIPWHHYLCWERNGDHYGKDSAKNRTHQVQRASLNVHHQADGSVDIKDHESGPREEGPLVRREFNPSVL